MSTLVEGNSMVRRLFMAKHGFAKSSTSMWSGGNMSRFNLGLGGLAALVLAAASVPADAQSFRVQCPTSTITHPVAPTSEPAYTAPTYTKPTTTGAPADYTTGKTGPANGAIKCQQVAGGDGYATMADGTQTYLFAFGPLSGLNYIAQGLPGTTFPSEFNLPIADPSVLVPGYPAALADPSSAYRGAIGIVS